MRIIPLALLVTLAALASPSVSAEDEPKIGIGGGAGITNPYQTETKWRVWRDDATPIPNVTTLVREGKEKKGVVITLTPTPVARRIYPAGPPRDGEPIKWVTAPKPSTEFAGVWDDVYASLSGLHGYVRSTWHTKDGSAVHLRPKGLDHIMHFVEVKKTAEILRCGINFVHQSTTGMAHTITNAYNPQMTKGYEEIYFSDCLVTAPAHASFTETWPDRTSDLYIALVPSIFHSVGSSNSETMAITKLIVAAGYMPPESKRILKENGLYPGALLYMWKAALPFDVPYDHELRHRIAYRALGRNDQFPGKYGHAGGERGNLAIEFHRYDEIAHMRNMIRIAMAMKTLPPEAVLDDVTVTGGRSVYSLRKAALVIQDPGQEIAVTFSTALCYDLAKRPLSVRFRLLYGNRDTTVTPGDSPGTYTLRVPWDESLPEGRTAVALIANNGVHDSNPAIINVYRKRGDLPPPGAGPGGYKYNSPHANRRPVLLDLQDRVVTPGETVTIDLRAIDPEGQPVRIENRAGEPGDLDGNRFTFTVPTGAAGKTWPVTFIASDATAGNSYAAKQIDFVTAPAVHAHITCDSQVGPAPFTVKVSAEGSRAASGKLDLGWEFGTPAPKRKAAAFDKQAHGKTATHTFEKPGLYEVALTVKSGKEIDLETLSIWVTKGAPPIPPGGISVEGNGARIRDGADRPNDFDHTRFGRAGEGERIARTFVLLNRGAKEIATARRTVTIAGKHASDFRVSRAPRKAVSVGGSATFAVEFRPRGGGTRTATVVVSVGSAKIRFAVAGEGAIDQAKLDAAAEPSFRAAKKLFDDRKWARAKKALEAFLDDYPGAKPATEVAALLERIRTDAGIVAEMEAAAKAEGAARDRKKEETRAKSLFRMAESAATNGRDDLAEKYYRKILAKYPDTTWAAKAKERLK